MSTSNKRDAKAIGLLGKALITAALAAVGPIVLTAPAAARVTISYKVVSEMPNVQIAYAPGEWRSQTLSYSNMEGQFAFSTVTSPHRRPPSMYLAVRGTSVHCRIRVAGEVVAVDNSPTEAVCRA